MKLIDKERLVEFLDNYQINKETTVMDLYRDTLRAIQNMEVEAIPISWIEEWLEKMPKHTTPYFYKSYLRNAIRGMVKDWRKENESNDEILEDE